MKKELITATALAAVVSDVEAQEATSLGAFGQFGGSLLGAMLGGGFGAVAGAVGGYALGSQYSTTDIGSSTPIGAYNQNGAGVFPTTVGIAATKMGTNTANFETAMRLYRVVFSKGHPAFGKPDGGSGGFQVLKMFQTLGATNSIASYHSMYKSLMGTDDRRRSGLRADSFIDNFGKATAAGGWVRDDGCGPQFYTDLRTVSLIPSGRQAYLTEACRAGGFRSVGMWSHTINHKSMHAVPTAHMNQHKTMLKWATDGLYGQKLVLVGIPLPSLGKEAAQETILRRAMWPWGFGGITKLISKTLDELLRNGHRRVAVLRYLRDVINQDNITDLTGHPISDAALEALYDAVQLGMALGRTQRRYGGLEMIDVMRDPNNSFYPIAFGHPPVIVRQNVVDALARADNEDVFAQLMAAYLDWGDSDHFNVLSWNATTGHLIKTY